MNLVNWTRRRLLRHSSDRVDSDLLEINNIIYNEKTKITAVFKDFLIKDDLSEFLKRFASNSAFTPGERTSGD